MPIFLDRNTLRQFEHWKQSSDWDVSLSYPPCARSGMQLMLCVMCTFSHLTLLPKFLVNWWLTPGRSRWTRCSSGSLSRSPQPSGSTDWPATGNAPLQWGSKLYGALVTQEVTRIVVLLLCFTTWTQRKRKVMALKSSMWQICKWQECLLQTPGKMPCCSQCKYSSMESIIASELVNTGARAYIMTSRSS